MFPIVIRVTVRFIVVQQSDKPRDDSGVDNFLNSFVRANGEVNQSPASFEKNISVVVVVDKLGQGGKNLPDCMDTGWRIIVGTQAAQKPSDIKQ
jgi:hypothetical protein